MNLITLDFRTIALIVFGLFLIGVAGRIAQALGRFSERLIIFVAQSGMPGLARAALSILIGYDELVYRRSRFEFRNQVGYRFSLLWGSFLGLALLLLALHVGNLVSSVGTTWLALFIAYVGFRSLLYWNRTALSAHHSGEDGQSFSPLVKERYQAGFRQSPTLIRRWDYLDELFAESV